jgi:hypothetical protein
VQRGDCFIADLDDGRRTSVVISRESYMVLMLHDDGSEEWLDLAVVMNWDNLDVAGPVWQIPGDEDEVRRVFMGAARVAREQRDRLMRRLQLARCECEERTRVIDLS